MHGAKPEAQQRGVSVCGYMCGVLSDGGCGKPPAVWLCRTQTPAVVLAPFPSSVNSLRHPFKLGGGKNLNLKPKNMTCAAEQLLVLVQTRTQSACWGFLGFGVVLKDTSAARLPRLLAALMTSSQGKQAVALVLRLNAAACVLFIHADVTPDVRFDRCFKFVPSLVLLVTLLLARQVEFPFFL